jgi:ATP-dependent DNA helicase RecG
MKDSGIRALPRAFGTGAEQSLDRLERTPLRSLPRPSALQRSVSGLPGVGPAAAKRLGKLGIETAQDLLEHLPFDHRDYEGRRSVAQLGIGEEATVLVRVRDCRVRPTRRRRLQIVEARVADDTGPLKAVWFNQSYLVDQLKEGTVVLLRGRLESGGGGPTFKVSEHEIVREGDEAAGRHTTGLVPIYPATEGLSARRIRDLAHGLAGEERNVVEPLPARLRACERLPSRPDALNAAHWPTSTEDVAPARRRLAFEELFLFQLALVGRRRTRQEARRAETLGESGSIVERWLGSLPFELTEGQREALKEIDEDLVTGRPMQRLLMGEVGSGKTVVALYAMLRVAEAGMQAAIMAPTETLAEQHYATVERLVPPDLFAGVEATRLGPPIGLLTGSTPARERRDVLERLAAGELRLLVGTHAVIQDAVRFQRLALAVVDEQHRFGVRQRTALDLKASGGLVPHILHMTATPIPRTLSLTLYGDLHTTALRELPQGRRPVKTWVVPEEKREGAYEYIRGRLREGRQCFVVCPLVEESEQLQARAATREAERLATTEFRDHRVAVMHGQMRAKEKRDAMTRFAAGDLDVLVATSVIEVGIDVPNATVMVIEEADRYGISQLHQLRGRVGRGEHESYCLLFSGSGAELARRRLDAVAAERDGFRLAEVDLTLRGEGDLLGTKQSGLPEFKVARLPEDAELLERARRASIELLRSDPELSSPENGVLRAALEGRFGALERDRIAA